MSFVITVNAAASKTYLHVGECMLNAHDGWNITLRWQRITYIKETDLRRVLANDLLKTSFRERREGTKDECVCVCVCVWRGVCGGESKFWLSWPWRHMSWISKTAYLNSPGITIKGPINFQLFNTPPFTHTHTEYTHACSLAWALKWQRAAEVNKVMHQQDTPGQLEVKRCVTSHAD